MFVNTRKIAELEQIINDESLDRDETYKFITNAFRDCCVQSGRTALSRVLTPVPQFTPAGGRYRKKGSVPGILFVFFARFRFIVWCIFIRELKERQT